MKKENNMSILSLDNPEQLREVSFLTPDEVGKILRIGANGQYKFLNNDCPVPVLRIGKLMRIPTKQFWQWYDSMVA